MEYKNKSYVNLQNNFLLEALADLCHLVGKEYGSSKEFKNARAAIEKTVANEANEQDKSFCLADILLPGATLDDLGGEIDINDPEIQRLLKDSIERQRQVLSQLNISDEQLNQRITI